MFYLFIPILVLLIGKYADNKLRKIIWLSIIYITGITWRLFFITMSEYIPIAALLRKQMPGYLDYFAAGMALFYSMIFLVKQKRYWLLLR